MPCWRRSHRRRRGRLKLFLARPRRGKTWAMLAEAAERRAQGLDVLVGWVDTHGRADTEAMLAGLEVLPRQARAIAAPNCGNSTWTACWRAGRRWWWWTNWRTATPPAAVIPALAGRGRTAGRRH